MKTLQIMMVTAAAAMLGALPTWTVAHSLESTPTESTSAATAVEAVPSTFGVFIEPLIAFEPYSAIDLQDLQTAAAEYQAAGDPTRIESRQGYLTAHPDSPWRGSILANIGIMYEREFFISKTLDFLAQAQNAMPIAQTPAQRAIADAVVGAQLRLHAPTGSCSGT